MSGLKVTAFGAAGAGFAAIMQQLLGTCPELMGMLPALGATFLTAALGFWLRSPKAETPAPKA